MPALFRQWDTNIKSVPLKYRITVQLWRSDGKCDLFSIFFLKQPTVLPTAKVGLMPFLPLSYSYISIISESERYHSKNILETWDNYSYESLLLLYFISLFLNLPLFFTALPPLSGFWSPPSCTLHLVTMQIYLSHPAKKTGTSENAVAAAVQLNVCPSASGPCPDKAASDKRKVGTGKKPPCTLSLHRSTCQSPFSPAETPIYKSPIKSPSQYFQICY